MTEKQRVVVYDVEVERDPKTVEGGFDNPEALGFASAVAYDYSKDVYEFFLGSDHLEDLLECLDGSMAVTFNGVKFDSRVVLGNDRIASPCIPGPDEGLVNIRADHDPMAIWWQDYDILLKYVQALFGLPGVGEAEAKLGDKAIHDGSFGLDGLAEGTFGLRKTGHGAKAPILYQEGRYAELLAYNLQDVRLTKKLFDFIQANGFVVDRDDRVVRIV